MIESQNTQGFSGLELQMPILDENPTKNTTKIKKVQVSALRNYYLHKL